MYKMYMYKVYKIKEDVPWLMFVHCFNHLLELAIKNGFSGTCFIY